MFLMDEPLSNLDAKLRVTMRAELKHLHHELGVTTVYVTHDQMEAMTLATRVAVMREGRIVQLDTPKKIYAEPADLFVAGFIGSPSMNLIDGTVTGGVFRAEGIEVPCQAGRSRRCCAGHPARRAGNRGRCFGADRRQALCAGTDRRQHAGNPARRPHVGLCARPRRL